MALTHTQIFTHMPVPVLATTHTAVVVVVVVNGLMGLKSCGGCVNVSPAPPLAMLVYFAYGRTPGRALDCRTATEASARQYLMALITLVLVRAIDP